MADKKRWSWWVSYFKESWAVTAAAFGAITASITLGLGWWQESEFTIPYKLIWLVSMIVTIGAQMWIYRSLYLRYAALKSSIEGQARLPLSQRERIYRIKELAGRINAGLLGMGRIEPHSLEAWKDQLYEESGAIAEHTLIAAAITFYIGGINEHLDAIEKTDDAEEKKKIWQEMVKDQELYYREVVRVCNDLLEKYSLGPGT
jgi:hypothetical protein